MDNPNKLREKAHALLDALLDQVTTLARVEASAATPDPRTEVVPVATAAARLGWRRRRLVELCRREGVPIHGERKRAAVDLVAVRAALARMPTQPRFEPPAALRDDLEAAFGVG
jgi:hypothetical protein